MKNNIKKFVLIFIFALSFLMLFCPQVVGQENKQQIIITIDCLTTEEFWNLSCWDEITYPKAWGLMSPYTPSPNRQLNSYLTMGLGIPVTSAIGDRGLAYKGKEVLDDSSVAEIFQERTGISVGPEEICIIDLNEHQESIKSQNPQAYFGALGDVLKEAGYSRAVLGNSDLIAKKRRNTPFLVADSKGLVDGGDVTKNIQLNNSFAEVYFPTDYEELYQQFLAYQDIDILIMELGDISRLEENRKSFVDEQFFVHRQNYIEKIDNFLRQVFAGINLDQTRVIVLVPNNSALNPIRSLLPVVMLGEGVQEEFLISPTTKRLGIIANIDIAPSILNYWNLEVPAFMYGRAIKVIGSTFEPIEHLRELNAKTNFVNAYRPPIIKVFIFSQIVAISLFLFLLLRKKISSKIGYSIFIFITIVPVALLWMGLFNIISINEYLLIGGICIGLLLTLSFFLSQLLKNDIMSIICLVTVFTILGDLALGSPLMKNSVLGYDPVRGARFYGIGNEYMGVLIGSLIIGVTFFLQNTYYDILKYKWILYMVSFIFLITIFFMGSPQLGTNVGGTIAACIGLTVTILKLANFKLDYKTIFLTISFMLLALISLFVVEIFANINDQTHIGRLVTSVRNQGIGAFIVIVIRKITINLKLIRYTNWSLLFLISLISLLFTFYKPFGMTKEIYSKYPYLASGIVGVLAGSITALLVNDSGIVAAATMMVFPVNVLMYAALKEK